MRAPFRNESVTPSKSMREPKCLLTSCSVYAMSEVLTPMGVLVVRSGRAERGARGAEADPDTQKDAAGESWRL
ncbi:MAG: hypothetical protein DHS20C15_15340 [Planctomycetota bacterium]|nr:MAG: hypothetical protein DHS20C15_15340 [Planctomycetota bacterium]